MVRSSTLVYGTTIGIIAIATALYGSKFPANAVQLADGCVYWGLGQ